MKIGDRVKVDTFLFKGEGTINYIDEKEMFGIQVELDKGDDQRHRLKRVAAFECKII